MKRLLFCLLAFTMIISFAACDGEGGQMLVPTESGSTIVPALRSGELTILFTGGLNGNYTDNYSQGTVGYAALKAYVDKLKDDNRYVVLIDGGQSISSDSDQVLWDIVDTCRYDLRIPGALELVSGVDALISRAKDLKNGTFVSCNLFDIESNKTVFDPYVLMEIDNAQVGFVGVTKPDSLIEQDKDRYMLVGLQDGQAFRDLVQAAVDQAANAGADYVVVVGNLGTSLEDTPCTAVEVISGITGMVTWLDCGSGAVLNGDTVTDKDDFEIPVCAPGSDFSHIVQLDMDLGIGTVKTKLLTEFDKTDRTIRKLIEQLESKESADSATEGS